MQALQVFDELRREIFAAQPPLAVQATLRTLWAAKDLPSCAQWDRAARGPEGMVVTDIWEWVRADSGAGRRGHKGARTGGFRCTSPAALLLSLLAI